MSFLDRDAHLFPFVWLFSSHSIYDDLSFWCPCFSVYWQYIWFDDIFEMCNCVIFFLWSLTELVCISDGDGHMYHQNGGVVSIRPGLELLDSPSVRKRSRHAARLKMGDTKDDIHVCIMCLRAIMNNKVIKKFIE